MSILPDNRPERTELLVMIISRRSWEELQRWHRAYPGSTVEHLMHGLYVLTVPAGGVKAAA